MKKYISIIAISVVLFGGCEINQKDISPTDNFIKIYNNPDEELIYYSESVLEFSDGYMILSAVKNYTENLNEYPTTSIIRTNELGEVIWTTELDWRAPVSELLDFADAIGFVAMNSNDDGYFVQINPATGEIIDSKALGIKMPLAAKVNTSGNLIVLSYDYVSWSSVVSLFSSNFNQISSEKLAVGDDLVVPIQKHLNKSNDEFPFFIGEWQNENQSGFFVNCLSNFTLGVRFFANDGSSTGGWIISHQIENAVSSLIHKENDSYGITRYFNHKNYINPTVYVDVNSLQNFNDSTQNPLPKLVPDAYVGAIKASFDNTDYLLFASTSNSNSIEIYQYKMDQDELLHKIEISFADKIIVSQIIQDSNDNGILILAKLFVTGRYLRPVLIKVPERDFKK